MGEPAGKSESLERLDVIDRVEKKDSCDSVGDGVAEFVGELDSRDSKALTIERVRRCVKGRGDMVILDIQATDSSRREVRHAQWFGLSLGMVQYNIESTDRPQFALLYLRAI